MINFQQNGHLTLGHLATLALLEIIANAGKRRIAAALQQEFGRVGQFFAPDRGFDTVPHQIKNRQHLQGAAQTVLCPFQLPGRALQRQIAAGGIDAGIKQRAIRLFDLGQRPQGFIG